MNQENSKKRAPLVGIDVSAYQGEIDWQQVSNASISFAFIKATEGASFVDKAFSKNIAGARAAKIACGAYHFFRPKVPVKDQIRNFVTTVKSIEPGDLQPVLDLESANDWNQISMVKRIQMVEQWVEGVKQALKVEPIIYLSPSFARDVFNESTVLSKYTLWVAHYTLNSSPAVPLPWHRWTFWQYTNRGRVEGVKTAVDLDMFNGSYSDLERLRFHQPDAQ